MRSIWKIRNIRRVRRIQRKFASTVLAVLCCLLMSGAAVAQTPAPPATVPDNAAFFRAADEVLAEMSKLLSLPVLQPLKKSLRSRPQIHDYLVDTMKEDKDQAKRDADTKTMVALGLIPKGYPLDQKLLSLLTEQIAGLYDPKSREFFIADWTSPADQRMIMAHELTHALQDQHFHIQKWEDSVKSNDDATLARDAVLEGSATVAMLDYALRDSGKSIQDLPGGFDFSQLLGDVSGNPELACNAPMVLRDEMLFPYVAGGSFFARMLKQWNGWGGMHLIFEKPPKSTQQQNPAPRSLSQQCQSGGSRSARPAERFFPRIGSKLDTNLLGEFGVHGNPGSSFWASSVPPLFPQPGPAIVTPFLKTRRPARISWSSAWPFGPKPSAARYFGGYSEVLELKGQGRRELCCAGRISFPSILPTAASSCGATLTSA